MTTLRVPLLLVDDVLGHEARVAYRAVSNQTDMVSPTRRITRKRTQTRPQAALLSEQRVLRDR